MVLRLIAAPLLLSALMLILAGCGEKTVTAAGSTKLVQSEACFNNNCHQNAVSPGSGKNIPAEWKLSVHNTLNGAGCADCHDPEPGHPDSCNRCHGGTPSGAQNSTNHVSKNPDTDGKCRKCHGSSYTDNGIFNITTTDAITNDVKFLHFSSGNRANFVASNYVGNCRKCHNPHDTTSGRVQRQQWSRSGHGDTTSGVRTSRDFKASGSSLRADLNYGPFCVRCHTSTGFINFVTSNFTNVRALPDLDGVRNDYPTNIRPVYQDKTREVTNCDVCHSDGRLSDGSAYSGKLRNVPNASIFYNMSAHATGGNLIRTSRNIVYDDLGNSNLCMSCHAGREVGEVIKDLEKQGLFSYAGNAPGRTITVSAHDLVTGANLQGKSGFHFYTSAAKYVSNPSHKAKSTLIGGANGACIGCHMSNERSHYFLPVTWNDDNISNPITAVLSEPTVCIKCHDGSPAGGQRRDTNFMNTRRNGYRAAVLALKALLPPTPNPNNGSQWKTFGNYTVAGSGNIRAAAYTMGANFNAGLFGVSNDPAGYTHNPTYSKQLIYDSIEWLVYNNKNKGTASFRFVPGVSQADIFAAIKALPTSSFAFTASNVIFATYTADDALSFICKGYVSGVSTTCDRY